MVKGYALGERDNFISASKGDCDKLRGH